jgi:hypothetical protein
MPSTRDLSSLVDVGDLRRLSHSLAMLNAILKPTGYRDYSFTALCRPNQSLAYWDDLSGDLYFIRLDDAGAIIKGHAHESDVWARIVDSGRPYPGVLEGIPEEFADFEPEPPWALEAFGGFTTFCLWRRHTDPAWQTGPVELPPGPDPDGSADLLQRLDGDAEGYRTWAEDYFNRPVARWAVDHLYAHIPLNERVVRALHPQLSLTDLAGDVSDIGYPI